MAEPWESAVVAPDGTHHVRDGASFYAARFAEVLSFHPPGLAAVRDDSGAFHIQPDGRPAYGSRFRRTFGFYEGLAAVEDLTGAFHIDVEGRAVAPAGWTWCGNFQGGRAVARDGDGYLHLRRDGCPAYAARWRYAGDFREGLAVVMDDAGRHGFINVDGQAIGERRFADLDVFHKGFARARDGGGWFHLTRAMRSAYAQRYAAAEPFYNGQARCQRFDGAIVLVDESGRETLEVRAASQTRRDPFHAL